MQVIPKSGHFGGHSRTGLKSPDFGDINVGKNDIETYIKLACVGEKAFYTLGQGSFRLMTLMSAAGEQFTASPGTKENSDSSIL